VAFLAGFRRAQVVDLSLVDDVLAAVACQETIAGAE
jgi:hypothetical protein